MLAPVVEFPVACFFSEFAYGGLGGAMRMGEPMLPCTACTVQGNKRARITYSCLSLVYRF